MVILLYSLSTFTLAQQNNIKNKILDPNDISGTIGFYNINPSKIVFGNDSTFTDYILDSLTQEIHPAHGVIVVVPRSNLQSAGLTRNYPRGGIISRGTIYLRPAGLYDGLISHEFGHMFGGAFHPTSLYGQSVMANPVPIPTTGLADNKAGKLLYEQTFIIDQFPGEVPPSVDFLDNILGRNWGSWYAW